MLITVMLLFITNLIQDKIELITLNTLESEAKLLDDMFFLCSDVRSIISKSSSLK